jgi:hypothetical protein
MKVTEGHGKLKDKQETNKKKLKKFNELATQNKRQAVLLEQRSKEIGSLRMELSQIQNKLQERERVHY